MQEALKTMPVMDFKAPPGTVFAQVGPNREAFQPGTEPRAFVPPALGTGEGSAVTPLGPIQPTPARPGPPPPKSLVAPKRPEDIGVPF